jgi:L-ascorbate metabolism protein UlaG (beta-lactamase superfamily)
MRILSLAVLFVLSITNASSQAVAGISRLHYFYNSGWLVETQHHLLVFDFIPHAESNISFNSLLDELQKTSVPDKELLMFISHGHQDHFNDSIFSLKPNNLIPKFIIGWKPAKPPIVSNLTVLSPGDSIIRKGLSVFTHPATDDGSAFLVKVDGLVIYHAGDHALWIEDLLPQFTKELKKTKTKAGEIDLAFIPAARGMFTKCVTDSTIEKGVQLSVSILQPQAVALQHIGCEDKLFQYEQISKRLTGIKTRWISPKKYHRSYLLD